MLTSILGLLTGAQVAYATSTMGQLITDASTQFASTTGFSVSAVVQWAGDNLIKLFIGSGLSVLYELRYWIVALVIIAAVVYFSYRAFQFFRH
jgi:hypothetical protein